MLQPQLHFWFSFYNFFTKHEKVVKIYPRSPAEPAGVARDLFRPDHLWDVVSERLNRFREVRQHSVAR